MTDSIRHRLQRKRRPFFWTCAASGAGLITILLATWTEATQVAMYLFGAAFVLYFGSFICLSYVKCPRCVKQLPLMPTTKIPGFSTMDFCPCCGVDLDTEIGADV